jgi:hypothetical protein
MDDARNIKGIYRANLHHKRPKGSPKAGWKEDVENDTRKTGIVNLLKPSGNFTYHQV